MPFSTSRALLTAGAVAVMVGVAGPASAHTPDSVTDPPDPAAVTGGATTGATAVGDPATTSGQTDTTDPTDPSGTAAPADPGGQDSTGSSNPTAPGDPTDPGPVTDLPTAAAGDGSADPNGAPLCDAACGQQIAAMVNDTIGQLWAGLFGVISNLNPPPAGDTAPPADAPGDQPTDLPADDPTVPDPTTAPTAAPTAGEPTDQPVTGQPVTDQPVPDRPVVDPPLDPNTNTNTKASTSQVLALINTARKTAGCDPLIPDPAATAAAQTFADAQAAAKITTATLSHTAPDGTTAAARLAALTGGTTAAGENIAIGQPDATAVVQAWLNSAGHKANIENCDYTVTGIGVANGAAGPYWVQEFTASTPQAAATTPAPAGATQQSATAGG